MQLRLHGPPQLQEGDFRWRGRALPAPYLPRLFVDCLHRPHAQPPPLYVADNMGPHAARSYPPAGHPKGRHMAHLRPRPHQERVRSIWLQRLHQHGLHTITILTI